MFQVTASPRVDQKALMTAALAGLVATAFTGVTDRLLDRFVSKEQKKRDRRIRKGSPHQIAGPYFAEKMMGRKLGESGEKRAQATFSITYSIVWGMIYATLRKKYPQLSRAAGLPFAIPFFFACDGFMAPLLGISPNLKKIPWQPSVKEMANHIAWTATAEMIHRAAAK